MPTETEELAALKKEFALFRRDVLMKAKAMTTQLDEDEFIVVDDMLTQLGLLGGDVPVVIRMMVPVTCEVNVSETVAAMDRSSQFKHFAKAKVAEVVFDNQIGFSMTSVDPENSYNQPSGIEIGDIVISAVERKTPPPPVDPYPGYFWGYSNANTARVKHLFPVATGENARRIGYYYASSFCDQVTTYKFPVETSAQGEERNCQRCARKAGISTN